MGRHIAAWALVWTPSVARDHEILIGTPLPITATQVGVGVGVVVAVATPRVDVHEILGRGYRFQAPRTDNAETLHEFPPTVKGNTRRHCVKGGGEGS